MRILHYSLGLPPYRTGGMTKFCIDLILRQKEAGETVALLWPGKIPVLSKKIKIRKADVYKRQMQMRKSGKKSIWQTIKWTV